MQDTSRVLQSRKLGLLITQLRELYDLIIIDSPPVLPVPDALILGRWADGAVWPRDTTSADSPRSSVPAVNWIMRESRSWEP